MDGAAAQAPVRRPVVQERARAHAYVYRLAAGGRFGGTAVTSMPQLVRGLARCCHPTWELSEDEFVDRDRYHTAVRPWLRDLQAMGLLDWRIGTDDDGEDRRTELVLRAVPELMPDELDAAAERLALWEARYGLLLNTGSRSGVRDAPVVAAPLEPAERQRRAITRVKRRREARQKVSEHNCAPPCGAGPSAQNGSPTTNLTTSVDACSPRSRVTRPPARATAGAGAAPKVAVETTSLKMAGVFEGSGVVGTDTVAVVRVDDDAALLARVAGREAQREPLYELISSHATRRAEEVATWSSARGWPLGRLREAWVVARRGARYVAEWSAESRWGAGPMQPDDLERLRRAARRYERHRGARPGGYPELGLAALLHIAAVAAERDARPQTLHYGILALDQLSVRMRAAATADDPKRRGRQAGRARRRVFEPAPAPGMLAFRTGARSPWPAWVALDRDGAPILVNGELQFVDDAGVMRPERSDPWYRDTLRDAYLLAGLWSPLGMDGRAEMAADQQVVVDDAGERTLRARPGPYELPGDRRDRLATDAVPGDVRELARRAGMSLAAAADLDVDERAQLLERYRANAARRAAAPEQPRVVEPVHHPACPCDACSSTPPPAAPPAAAIARSGAELERDWEAICGELRRAVADTTYEIWLAPLAARAVVDGTLVIVAPGEIRSWVADRFASVLQACAAKVLGAGVAIEVVAMDARC